VTTTSAADRTIMGRSGRPERALLRAVSKRAALPGVSKRSLQT
jgi:hypothetical protein